MPEPTEGKLIWLDTEVCDELQHAINQGIMGSTHNEIIRKMLRLLQPYR